MADQLVSPPRDIPLPAVTVVAPLPIETVASVAVAPVTWPKVSNVNARSCIKVLPLWFSVRLLTDEVSWWDIVIPLSVPTNKPEMSIPVPSIRSIASPGNTSSTFTSLTLISKDGLVAWYLVSKSAVVTPVTWPWALVTTDLIYWPSCVPVWPYVPAVPWLSWSILIVSVPGAEVKVIESKPLRFKVSAFESATTSLPGVSSIVNVLNILKAVAATEPLSVLVIVIILSPLPTVVIPAPWVRFNVSELTSAVALVPLEGATVLNIFCDEPLSVLI